jgi:hypothetical protein
LDFDFEEVWISVRSSGQQLIGTSHVTGAPGVPLPSALAVMSAGSCHQARDQVFLGGCFLFFLSIALIYVGNMYWQVRRNPVADMAIRAITNANDYSSSISHPRGHPHLTMPRG